MIPIFFGHVLMWAEIYQRLIERLQELEDRVLGQKAETALSESQMVGVKTFTATLESLANDQA